MHVTVCISTRNRGASIVATLRQLVAAHYDDFDVVIVDQSTTDATAQAVSEFVGDDTRFTEMGQKAPDLESGDEWPSPSCEHVCFMLP